MEDKIAFSVYPQDIPTMRQILRTYPWAIIRRLPYISCPIDFVKDIEKVDALTLAHMVAACTYLMAECKADQPVQFAHFTSHLAAATISRVGFALDKVDANSDFDGICCFRVDAMSRPFKVAGIDTAVIFDYVGDYLSCIRQEDSNSNIGYQLITDTSMMSNIRILPMADFCGKWGEQEPNLESVLVHHGLPLIKDSRLKGIKNKQLSTVLPVVFNEFIEAFPDERKVKWESHNKTTLFGG